MYRISPVEYTVGYYLDPANLAWTHEHVKDKWVYGLFQSFRLSWLVVIIGLLFALQRKNWNAVLFIFLPVALAASQYYFAYDLSCLGGLAYPAFSWLLINCAKRIRPGSPLGNCFSPGQLFRPGLLCGALDPLWYGPFWMK